ncbi:MAG: hypothetical protein AB1393_02215 [Candidatus Edwardsbacteria bacterium]
MTGSESQVLKIIREAEESDKESIARKMGVSSEYVAEICHGLVKDGYLVERANGRYRVTPQGQKVISPVKAKGPIGILKGGL